MSKADIPTNACWIDIDAFEEEITTVEMIREATQAWKVEKKVQHGLCTTSLALRDDCNADDFGSVVWTTGNISLAKVTSAVMFNQSTDVVAQWGSQIPGFASSMSAMSEGKFVMAAELNSQENPYGDGPASSDQYSENSGGRS
jgi:hypothetical protein